MLISKVHLIDWIASNEIVQLVICTVVSDEHSFESQISASIIELLQDRPGQFERLCLKLVKTVISAVIIGLLCCLSWTLLVFFAPFVFLFTFKVLKQLKLALNLKRSIENAITSFLQYHQTCSQAISKIQEL